MLYQTTTHASLLARLSTGGDPLVWREFCDRYEDLIRGFARRQGVVGADADDVVQEVMLALTKAMPGFRYDPAKGKFRSYLKTTVVRAIWRRSCQKTAALPLQEDASVSGLAGPAAADEQEEVWESEWRQYHLRTAMKGVRAETSQSDMAAFDLYVEQGLPAEEVARTLEMSVDRVYQAKSRVLRRLGDAIARQVEEEG